MNKLFFYSALGIIATIIFSFTSPLMASLYVLGALGGSPSTASYSIAVFGIANGTAIPLGLTFGGRFGRRAMTEGCLFLYILVTYCLGLASNYPTFIVLRFFQGFFSGPLLILIPSMLTTLATREQRLGFTRNISIVFIVISIVATCVGGTIAYEFNWRWIFLIDGVIPSFIFIFFHSFLRDKKFPINKKPFDLLGYFAFFVSVWSLSLFIILGQELDWFTSNLLVTFLIIFFISFPLFVLQSKAHPNPIVHFKLLQSPTMIVALIQLAVLFGTYYGIVFLLSIWLRQNVNYTPIWISLVLGAMLLSATIIMLLVARLKMRNSPYFLLTGLVVLFIGAVTTMRFNPEVNFGRIALSRVVEGVGFALFLPPLLYMILSSTKENRRFDGLALFHITRTIGCGLGLAFFSTIWQRRGAFYHLRLGSELTPFSERVGIFFSQTKTFFFTPAMSAQGLEKALQSQAISLALNDCFYLIAVLMVALIVLLVSFLIFKAISSGDRKSTSMISSA